MDANTSSLSKGEIIFDANISFVKIRSVTLATIR